MFVEFADHHYNYLKDFLQERYPHINRTTRSKLFIGSIVFSRYPITDKAHEFPQGAWRYGYFSLLYEGQEIYVYLVHTSSPDRYQHFLMRNEQLAAFVDDVQLHASERKHEHLIIAGDFNTTPWSPYYRILADAFSGQLENITRHLPFLFTRRFFPFPLVQAHIDHLRISPSLDIHHLEVIRVSGSDHKGFLFRLRF